MGSASLWQTDSYYSGAIPQAELLQSVVFVGFFELFVMKDITESSLVTSVARLLTSDETPSMRRPSLLSVESSTTRDVLLWWEFLDLWFTSSLEDPSLLLERYKLVFHITRRHDRRTTGIGGTKCWTIGVFLKETHWTHNNVDLDNNLNVLFI